MVKLEVGKYYRTRGGLKVKIDSATKNEGSEFYSNDLGLYRRDGTFGYGDLFCTNLDIIAEWQDSPVRTVTRKEIVPGAYGKVRVTEGKYVHVNSMHTSAEIRAAIATLTEIADAMDNE